MTPAELHRKSVDSITRVIENIKPEQMSTATNLKWDVKGVLNHILGLQYASPHIFAGEPMPKGEHDDIGEKDMVGDDVMKAWKEATDAANQAIAGADMEKIVHLSFGDLPGMVFANILSSEVLIHGWDIAHSTGQDDALDTEAVEAFYAFYEPQRQMLRESGAFGDKEAEVSPDADLQTRLLALLGRKR